MSACRLTSVRRDDGVRGMVRMPRNVRSQIEGWCRKWPHGPSNPGGYVVRVLVTLELPDDVAAHLRREADRRGMSLDELVTELASSLPLSPAPVGHRALGFVGIGASNSSFNATDADEILAEGFGRSCTLSVAEKRRSHRGTA